MMDQETAAAPTTASGPVVKLEDSSSWLSQIEVALIETFDVLWADRPSVELGRAIQNLRKVLGLPAGNYGPDV